jgi:methionyl-tRNA formyltransferase
MSNFVLFLMGKKGLSCLEAVVALNKTNLKKVVFATDKNVANDYAKEIIELCQKSNIPCVNRTEFDYTELNDTVFFIAISWRWLINENQDKLIVLHDSILPKYRGFNPLVSALINGENEIGVTAILANKEFDRGDIIGYNKVAIVYPLKIQEAIDLISICYQKLIVEVITKFEENNVSPTKQAEHEATYSLWRDEQDYFIDWNLDSNTIHRTINALGFPYMGAKTRIEKETIIIEEAEIVDDVKIENRTAGKLLFMENGKPVVVCGKGLIKLNAITSLDNKPIQISKFRTRFE